MKKIIPAVLLTASLMSSACTGEVLPTKEITQASVNENEEALGTIATEATQEPATSPYPTETPFEQICQPPELVSDPRQIANDMGWGEAVALEMPETTTVSSETEAPRWLISNFTEAKYNSQSVSLIYNLILQLSEQNLQLATISDQEEAHAQLLTVVPAADYANYIFLVPQNLPYPPQTTVFPDPNDSNPGTSNINDVQCIQVHSHNINDPARVEIAIASALARGLVDISGTNSETVRSQTLANVVSSISYMLDAARQNASYQDYQASLLDPAEIQQTDSRDDQDHAFDLGSENYANALEIFANQSTD